MESLVSLRRLAIACAFALFCTIFMTTPARALDEWATSVIGVSSEYPGFEAIFCGHCSPAAACAIGALEGAEEGLTGAIISCAIHIALR